MTGAKILVVEDERITALDIQETLTDLGYRVPAVAASGEEAVQKALETRPDLVLMDVMLKGDTDGIDAAGRIRARLNIPVVYLTAYTDEHTLARARPSAPFGYLVKPFNERELLTTIEMALYKHGADEALRKAHDDLERRVEERTAELRTANEQLQKEMVERKRAEDEARAYAAQLEAANKELEAFSYSVSHDLRAPLRSIDGFSQAALEDYGDRLDAQGKDYLRRIRAGSQRMGRLIDDLLALSRLTRQEMRRQPADLSAMAKAIVRDLRQAQPERRVDFVITEDAVVYGDRRLLRVVLENLLGNAWKFTGKQPRAGIEFGVTGVDGGPAYFVRDNGAGFDMAYADKLFGAFQRLHRADEFPGTGIGLASVQRIVRRHGGRVWAEGAVGQGAAFYFTL